jgi:Zn-dependent protease with chaperone function
MDFFQAQDSARTRTRTLVLLFVTAVAAIIIAIYAVVHVMLGPGPAAGVDPLLLLVVALATTGLVAVGSTVRTMQLRQGGPKVAELLGGRRVRPDSTDEAERRLINVVEEMSIASGTPVPAIYVLDNETGINAFAAGFTLDDAAVAVTRGTLEQLNRDELQGVIAHEFSHILNGDMRINIRLMGLLFGILLLAIVGRGLLYSGGRGTRGRRGNGGGQIAILGLALVVIGYIGVLFGKLIQAAVSRQREYLADAAAVQFTRSPDGLAGALRKIAGTPTGSRIEDHHAQEAGHLFFANGVGSSLASLLATHPPLKQRIRRIDPSFDGQAGGASGRQDRVAQRSSGATRSTATVGASGLASGVTSGLAGAEAGSSAARREPSGARAADTRPAVAGESLIRSIGAPQPEHVAFAGRLLASIPERVRSAAHDPNRAVALLFALLLHDEGDSSAIQERIIQDHGGDALWAAVLPLADDVRTLGRSARLPLLDLLLPALRELSPDQQRRLRDTAAQLSAADGTTDMFEFALLHILRRYMAGRTGAESAGRGASRLEGLREEVAFILSAVAWSGTGDASAASDAFSAGAASLRPQLQGLTLHDREAMKLPRVEQALQRLRDSAHGLRRRVLEACVMTVAHDGAVHTREAELLRAIAEAIDCPMPPAL